MHLTSRRNTFGVLFLIGCIQVAVGSNIVLVTNQTTETRVPVVELMGTARYESPGGLNHDGHWYLFFDLYEHAEMGLNAERVSGLSQEANNQTEVWLQPEGYITLTFDVPRADTYYLSLRLRQHGNADPRVTVHHEGRPAASINSSASMKWAHADNPLVLPEGRVTLELHEDRGHEGENVNMAMLDVLALSTRRNFERYNHVDIAPDDPNNRHWLKRFGVPLTNPILRFPTGQLAISGSLEQGEIAYIFPDGQWASTTHIDIDLAGRLPVLDPGDTWSVAVTDQYGPVTRPALRGHFMPVHPLFPTPSIITPNEDGVDDYTTLELPDGVHQIEIEDVFTKERFRIRQKDDQAIQWPAQTEPVRASFYRLAAPDFEAPIAIGTLRVKDAPPLAYAEPKVFSPNRDGVKDTTTFTFTLDATVRARLRVVDGEGLEVRALAAPREFTGTRSYTWDGQDDDGIPVPEGRYRIELLDDQSQRLRASPVEVDYVAFWQRAPINPEPDFFPFGVFYVPVQHPRDLSGMAYHRKMFALLRDHGFNTVLTALVSEPPAFYDLAHEHDLRVIPYFGHHHLPLNERQAADWLATQLAPIQGHPALLALYCADEPRIEPDRAARIHLMHRILEHKAPQTPPISCLIGLDRIEFYTRLLEPRIHFIDIYPLLPDAGPADFRNVFEQGVDLTQYVNLARHHMNPDAPLWTIVQAHNFGEWLRAPSPEELRAQLGFSLAYGAKGLFIFLFQPFAEMVGLLDRDFRPTPLLEESRIQARRLHRLAPLLTKLHAMEPVAQVMQKPANPYFDSVVSTFRGPDDALYLIVANSYVEGSTRMRMVLDESLIANSKALIDQETEELFPFQQSHPGLVAEFTMEPGDYRVFKLKHAETRSALRRWHDMTLEEQVPDLPAAAY